MNDKIEEQIKHIKEEHSTMGIGYHLDLLSTLIQEERKDAVRGFADLVYESFRNHDLKIHALIEEYLESEGKGVPEAFRDRYEALEKAVKEHPEFNK